MLDTIRKMLNTMRKPSESGDPVFQEGRLAFANGVARANNPYAESDRSAASWEAGWIAAEKARQKYFSTIDNDMAIGDSDAHPLWHVVFFIVLVTIFFPWSLLLLLLLFGWEGSVQIFRGLVIGTVGLVFLLLWLAIVLLVVIAVIALLLGWVL